MAGSFHSPRIAALGVHILTASGAGLGMMALAAAFKHDLTLSFIWLGLALAVDGLDGPLARIARVQENQPRINGELLDLVVDFQTYVVVPMIIVWQACFAGSTPGLLLMAVVASASALYFADDRMKTVDNWFRGFPAIWNVVAFYLVCFNPSQSVSSGVILLCAGLMFAPVVFVHPVRVSAFRSMTIFVMIVGVIAAIAALIQELAPDRATKTALALCAVWFLVLPFLRRKPD